MEEKIGWESECGSDYTDQIYRHIVRERQVSKQN